MSYGRSFLLIWVPRYSRIHENEQADMLARSAVELGGVCNLCRDVQLCLCRKIISITPMTKSLGQSLPKHHQARPR